MMDWTLPARRERYVFERLDLNLNRVGAMPGVLSCKLDWSIWSDILGSGDMGVRTPEPIDWTQTLLRVWQVTQNRSGIAATPLMTTVCRVPDEMHTARGVEAKVELYDRTIILAEWMLDEPYRIPAGYALTSELWNIFLNILGLGAHLSITDSALDLAHDLVWDPSVEDVSWLRVVNDILAALGYYSLRTDARGWFQMHPYVTPGARTPAYRFADDRQSLRFLPRIGVASSRFDSYNEWTAWQRAVEDAAPVKAIATNDDPSHPYSTVTLGYTRSAPARRDADALTLPELQAMVDRDKAEAMADQQTITMQARFVPIVEHDAAVVDFAAAGVRARVTLARRSLDCTPNAKLDLTFRRVS